MLRSKAKLLMPDLSTSAVACRAFFVGGAAASCQLSIIGRQRRRTAGTRRTVARPTGRERTGSTRTLTDDRSRNAAIPTSCSGPDRTGNAVHRFKERLFRQKLRTDEEGLSSVGGERKSVVLGRGV